MRMDLPFFLFHYELLPRPSCRLLMIDASSVKHTGRPAALKAEDSLPSVLASSTRMISLRRRAGEVWSTL